MKYGEYQVRLISENAETSLIEREFELTRCVNEEIVDDDPISDENDD